MTLPALPHSGDVSQPETPDEPRPSLWRDPLTIAFLAGLILASVTLALYLRDTSVSLVSTTALHSAERYAKALGAFRSVYSSEVVRRVAGQDVQVRHDYANHAGAIPLPATLTLLLGSKLDDDDVSVNLYSEYPFPWREDGGPKNGFEGRAIAEIQQRPDQPYHEFIDTDSGSYLNYAVADVMRESCVGCHNSHPESPKTDWAVGDVRGVLSVSTRVQDVSMLSGMGARIALVPVLIGLVAAIALALAFLRVRNESYRARVLGQKTAAQNRLLQRQAVDLNVATLQLSMEKQAAIDNQLTAEAARELAEESAAQLEQARLGSMKLLEEMEIARSQAESANMAKDEFLANMSHEIRTPMTAILGYCDLLVEPGIDEDRLGDHVETIRRNGQHLLAIINDILDISKLESGKLEVEMIPVAPAAIVEQVIALLRVRAREKELDLHLELSDSVPAWVLSDPTRLRQILLNLVGNAIKFTESGQVTIRVDHQVEANRPTLVFAIQDTGMGITGDQMACLFQPFSQADSTMTRRFGGTGLGLTISRRLTTLLGGDIAATSQEGRGSVFTVSISGVVTDADGPRTPNSQAPATPGADARICGRILVAEDGPDNQRLIAHILRKAGLEVDLVENGQEAVTKATEAWQAERPFDVILMDMQMPVLDGYAAVEELRRTGYDWPIVALTAHAMSHDRERCLAIGCDAFESKPFDRESLFSTLRALMARSATSR